MKVIIRVKNLHSCHKLSPKLKDFLAEMNRKQKRPCRLLCNPLLQNVAWQMTSYLTECGMLWAQGKNLYCRAGSKQKRKIEKFSIKSFLWDCKCR